MTAYEAENNVPINGRIRLDDDLPPPLLNGGGPAYEPHLAVPAILHKRLKRASTPSAVRNVVDKVSSTWPSADDPSAPWSQPVFIESGDRKGMSPVDLRETFLAGFLGWVSTAARRNQLTIVPDDAGALASMVRPEGGEAPADGDGRAPLDDEIILTPEAPVPAPDPRPARLTSEQREYIKKKLAETAAPSPKPALQIEDDRPRAGDAPAPKPEFEHDRVPDRDLIFDADPTDEAEAIVAAKQTAAPKPKPVRVKTDEERRLDEIERGGNPHWPGAPAKADSDDYQSNPPAAVPPVGDVPPPPPELPDSLDISAEGWLARDLPPVVLLFGEWLTTTSRVILSADTGLGKTNFCMMLGGSAAAGRNFLGWKNHGPKRVLVIDGEMSRRLMKERTADVKRRLGGAALDTLFVLSHEDVEGFAPLNTPAGQAMIEAVIKRIGGVDLIIFDNLMSLVVGDLKDGVAWAQVQAWTLKLSKRNIGQVWVNHTGHDASRGYGDKTKEWQMTDVIHLTKEERLDVDISFNLEFRKGRERRPDNRQDYQSINVWLVDDQWESDAVGEQARTARKPLQPRAGLYLDALTTALLDSGKLDGGQSWKSISFEEWRAELTRRNYLDPIPDGDKQAARRIGELFRKYRDQLVDHDLVACANGRAWRL